MDPTPARSSPRVPIHVLVTEIDGELMCAMRTRDISLDGMYTDAIDELCLDQAPQIAVEFELPGDEGTIWALCDVVRDDRIDELDGHALRFNQISEQDRARIARYVQRYHSPLARPLVKARAVPTERRLFKFTACSDLLC